MTRSQRLVPLALAAAVALLAVLLLTGGAGDDAEPGSTSARPTATATPTPTPAGTREPQELEPRSTPSPTARPQPPLLSPGRERTLTFTQGERVRFRVRTDGPEEIHVHGYDIERPVPAGETVTVAFEASIAGIFEVELHGSGAPLGRLRIEPR